MDPQQRLFLQCAWGALENAGYYAEDYGGLIGVYAATSFNSYSLQGGPGQVMLGQAFINDKDYLATRVSYKLGLRGRSATIQTACSSSLVAVAEACDSLLDYRSDMALAGGVSVWAPVVSGYFYQEGSILASDGHCRAFDARAQGTVEASGCGVVVRAHDRDRGLAECGLVAAEHLDRQLAREREEGRIGRHSSKRLISSTTLVQTPPSSTGCSATSGKLESGLPASDTLTSPTFVPSRSGAVSCNVKSMLAASAS